jgi:ankyrin repeat protein
MSTAARDYYGRTPLHAAVLSGHQEVVKELLDYGVDTSAVDSKAQTAPHLAAQRYSLKILELLLVGGADEDARDGEGRTPTLCIS